MLKEWLSKFKSKTTTPKVKKTTTTKTTVKKTVKKTSSPLKSGLSLFKKSSEEYPNRFLKFYHANKKRLNTERRGSYTTRKKQGLCVRCHKKALPNIVFCEFHKQKQKAYNKKARSQ